MPPLKILLYSQFPRYVILLCPRFSFPCFLLWPPLLIVIIFPDVTFARAMSCSIYAFYERGVPDGSAFPFLSLLFFFPSFLLFLFSLIASPYALTFLLLHKLLSLLFIIIFCFHCSSFFSVMIIQPKGIGKIVMAVMEQEILFATLCNNLMICYNDDYL